MKQTEHCILCENKISDFKHGAICGLTNEKADFQEKCNVIKLDKNFEEKIIETNMEHEATLKTKTDVYGLFVFYLIVSILIIIVGVVLGKYVLEAGVISTIPIIILSTSIITLGKAFGPFNYYNNSLKITKAAKVKVDTLALLYGYDYEIDIKHFKDSLGNWSYDTNLKLRRTNNQTNK